METTELQTALDKETTSINKALEKLTSMAAEQFEVECICPAELRRIRQIKALLEKAVKAAEDC